MAMMVAFVLRVYRLGEESAWADEFCSVVVDRSMSVQEFFAVHRYRNPDHIPFYYFLVYLWSMMAGTSDYGVRVISTLWSVLAIPFICLSTRQAGGRTASCFATALYCVSPFYIYHAQSVRPYGLVVLMAMIATWSLLQLSRSKSPTWWIINFAANAVMVYAHLSSAFMLAAQGLFLLMLYGRRIWPVMVWTAAHVAILIPPYLWMMVPPQDPWYQLPELWATLVNWFGDDVSRWNIELIFGTPEWAAQHPRLWGWILTNQSLFGAGMLLFYGAVSIGGTLLAVRALRGAKKNLEDTARGYALVMLLLLAFVPAALLLLVSFLKEPMPMPRYAVYASIGLYGLAGACLSSLKWRWAKGVMVGLAVLLYGYQAAATFQSTARTEWNQLREWVAERSSDDDILLIGSHTDPWFDIDLALAMIARHALDPVNLPVFCAHTQKSMVLDSVRALNGGYPEKPTAVWVVVFQIYDKRPLAELEQAFRDSGLNVERRDYLAMEGLTAFRLTLPPGTKGEPRLENLPGLSKAEVEQMLDEWGISSVDSERFDEIHRNLSSYFDAPPPPPMGPMSLAYLSLSVGAVDPLLALELAERALEDAPELATALFARGIALWQLGRINEAKQTLLDCREAPQDELSDMVEPLLAALISGDLEQARSAAERIDRLGAPLYTGLMELLGIRTRLGQP